MEKFTFHAPTEIVFGRETELQAGKLAKKYGGSRVFVIYGGKSAEKSGLISRVIEAVKAEGLAVEAMGGVVPNPLVSTARKMTEAARAFEADFILAVGGGSVMDTAKGVAHALACPGSDVWDFWNRSRSIQASTPIGAILTISAAGSETSDSAVLTLDEKTPPTKRGLTHPLNRPVFAIMNPELTMSLPIYQIGAGAADIFMHTAERYFTTLLGNHLTDEIAEGLFRDIIKYGPMGVEEPQNYEAMSEIMWCGSLSHNGLTGLGAKGDTPRDGDWACHQLGMAASALWDYTHGATLSAIWPAWARYVMPENYARFAQFARKVYGVEEADDAAAAELGVQKTEAFFRSLNMPVNYTELLGHTPTEEEIVALADECSYDRTRVIGTFKILTYEDMIAIYRNAR